jgi:4-nitrophenyl phosphatase
MAILIFDLDGVIWQGKKLVHPRIPSVIEKLHKDGNKIYFLTNNSTRNQYGYQRRLAGLGIEARRDEIICSANATRMYLRKKLIAHSSWLKTRKKKPRIFVIGEKALKKEIEKLPAEIVKVDDDGRVDYVVVGIDLNFSYKKLRRAMRAILDGAEFIGTNADRTVPIKCRMVPGCGSLLAAITTATNCKPYVVGKPNPFIIREVLDKLNPDRRDVYVIGDRLDTDTVVANRTGLRSILVLSGATTKEAAKKAKGPEKPQYIIKDITEIQKILNIQPRRH